MTTLPILLFTTIPPMMLLSVALYLTISKEDFNYWLSQFIQVVFAITQSVLAIVTIIILMEITYMGWNYIFKLF